jgi:hypothetical protein
MADLADSVARRYAVMRPHLSEFQRRLWLGAEAAELGPGGVAVVAQATGVAADTVRRGRKEADGGIGPGAGRSRRPGGGRKRAESHDEGLVAAFESLIGPVTRGDPMSPLRWTSKSIRALTAALRDEGHHVSDIVVRRLLRERGYSLQANAKTTEGGRHLDRDAQFAYLNDQATEHLAAGDPVISVDTKKKELVGAYKNGGREWQPKGSPEQVKVHDFIDPTLGKANPYGVYDVATTSGWVAVGTDHDTAAFAVNTIRAWWHSAGKNLHPNASRLLISADGGGSNGYRTRQWKTELAALRRHRPDDHRLPPAAGHLQVEQDRTPLVLPHLDELARQTIDQPRSDRRDHRSHHHKHRADRPRRTRPSHLPHRCQDPRHANESP